MNTKSTLATSNRAKTCLAAAVLLLLPGLASAQSIFNFSQTTYSCSESDYSLDLQVLRSGAADTSASVDYCTLDGTAHSGVRYAATSGTLAFAAGQTNLQVTVPLLNDGYVQGSQSFRVVLSHPSPGALLGTRTNATITVADNDMGIQFVNPSYDVSEGAGAVQVAIVRTGDGGNAASVDLFCADLTAKAGVDYVAVSSQVAFAPNEILKFVAIPILNNNLSQATRSFGLTLANVLGASLGLQTNATVNILDDDSGFRFQTTNACVSEDAGAVPLWVRRGTDDTNSTVSVEAYTVSQTALGGSDYVALTNTLTFAPGQTRQMITVPILNDGLKELNETFRVCLANPSAGATLGSPNALTVTIVDNDPQLGFEQAAYTNSWGVNEMALTVVRGNDTNLGPITVDYATIDSTARSGTDYQGGSGTLHFEPNQTLQTVRIPILTNRPAAAGKTFRVVLSNPSGGAVLGLAGATVRLQGAFFTTGPAFAPNLAMHCEAGLNLLTWLGGGQLQRADSLDGPWCTLTNVLSPHPVSSVLPGSFYRIKNPRPVNVYVPVAYDGHTPMPLIIALHGFGGSGAGFESGMKLTSFADSRGFLYCYPDGLFRVTGLGWNAWFDEPVTASPYSYVWSDDVGFIRSLIEAVASQLALDRKRVYLIGHSNGGAMAHFAAVRCADLIAGIASLANSVGVSYPPPSEPVNILQIHGTADTSYTDILPTAAPYAPLFPGALHSGQVWADLNGASGRVTDPAPTLDLDVSLAGLDTVITRWTNAPPGGAVEVWTIIGGHHTPSMSASFNPAMLDWLLAHPKP